MITIYGASPTALMKSQLLQKSVTEEQACKLLKPDLFFMAILKCMHLTALRLLFFPLKDIIVYGVFKSMALCL